jgi:hypothetical protein
MAMTIRQEWEIFKAQVLPADAPEFQVEECRRAFYSGFVCAADRDHPNREAEVREYREFLKEIITAGRYNA